LNNGLNIELSETPRQRLKWRVADTRYLLLGKLNSLLLTREERHSFDELTTFCCFIGHGRSGSSLVGALLNAHPNIVMSNELNALRRLHSGLTAQQLYRVIYIVSQRQVRQGSKGGGGYSYEVPGQWQGKHEGLRVIGDRKAGATAYEIVRNPLLLATLDRKVKLDKKFIHVIRNPFDTIATTCRYTTAKPMEDREAHVSREIRNYFARCTAVRFVQEKVGPQSVYNIVFEQLIADPLRQLRGVCAFLGVEPRQEYLVNCASILLKSPHESRRGLNWSDHQLATVRQAMKDFPWFDEYAVHS
jgi:hypothetical protein